MTALEILSEKLGPGKLTSSSKQEYEFLCPLCQEEHHLHVCLSKGVYLCVTPGCSNRGKIEDLIGKTNFVRTPRKDQINTHLLEEVYSSIVEHGKLRDLHRKWLLDRGVKDPDRFNLVSTDGLLEILMALFTTKELKEAGLLTEKSGRLGAAGVIAGGRVLFPYSNPFGNRFIYGRSRAVNQDNKAVKYLSPTGVPGTTMMWGWNNIKDNTPHILVTEGEIKAIVATELGFSCIGLPGMTAGHHYFAKACKLHGIPLVTILFDTEVEVSALGVPKQVAVDREARSLAKELVSAGITAYIAKLPADKEKMDIDTFVKREGANAFKALLDVINSGVRYDG